jgi:hypothetical protein
VLKEESSLFPELRDMVDLLRAVEEEMFTLSQI